MPACLCSNLEARERELASREAELHAVKSKAEARMAEANRMVDESLLVATKNQQEKKVLVDEVSQGCPAPCLKTRYFVGRIA